MTRTMPTLLRPDEGQCIAEHDWFNALLTACLIVGLVVSYAPQHLRIITKNTSEGLSPWFLLLGCTSSAAGMLNMVTLQWGIIRCCSVWSVGSCVEMTAGVVQVALQWLLFAVILVLYMIYYPPHLKHVQLDVDFHDEPMHPRYRVKTPVRSGEWRLSIVLSWVMFVHLILISFITLFLLFTTPSSLPPLPSQLPSSDPSPGNDMISTWATFLGVMSALLAALQYAPQLVHTYEMKLVGALSIPSMVIQSPGSFVMVLSIALRPGTNWTSLLGWIPYAISGLLQGSVLIMCLFWKARQRRLRIDDFGHPLRKGVDEIDIRVDVDVHIHRTSGVGGEVIREDDGEDDVLRLDVEGEEEEDAPLLGRGGITTGH